MLFDNLHALLQGGDLRTARAVYRKIRSQMAPEWLANLYGDCIAVEIDLTRISESPVNLYRVSAQVILLGDTEDKPVGTVRKGLYAPHTLSYEDGEAIEVGVGEIADALDVAAARGGALYDSLRREGEVEPMSSGWLHLGQIELLPAYRGLGISHYVMKEIVAALGSNAVVTLQPFPLGTDLTPTQTDAAAAALEEHWVRFGVKNVSIAHDGSRMLWFDMACVNHGSLLTYEGALP